MRWPAWWVCEDGAGVGVLDVTDAKGVEGWGASCGGFLERGVFEGACVVFLIDHREVEKMHADVGFVLDCRVLTFRAWGLERFVGAE